jgi:hypothetical protein
VQLPSPALYQFPVFESVVEKEHDPDPPVPSYYVVSFEKAKNSEGKLFWEFKSLR